MKEVCRRCYLQEKLVRDLCQGHRELSVFLASQSAAFKAMAAVTRNNVQVSGGAGRQNNFLRTDRLFIKRKRERIATGCFLS